MNDLSFFAKRRAFGKEDGHLIRGSSVIRGEQISEYLGAKLNPLDGYENDVCIYVKPNSKSIRAGDVTFSKYAYIDIVDGESLRTDLKQMVRVPAIACSSHDYEYLVKKLKNKIVLIPQHNCNFERFVRNRDKILTVGAIGAPAGKGFIPSELIHKIEALGLNFWYFSRFIRRKDILKFYKQIDIQLVWRPYETVLRNPLKIVNSSSFGVPTIALDEEAFSEVRDCYIPVKTQDEAIGKIKELMFSPEMYKLYSENCIKRGEQYHISKIAELYKKLEKYD